MVINSLNCIYHGGTFLPLWEIFFQVKSLTLTAMFILQLETLLWFTVVLFLDLTLWVKYIQPSYIQQSRLEGECTLLVILTRDRSNGLFTIWRCWHMIRVGVLLKAGRDWAAYGGECRKIYAAGRFMKVSSVGHRKEGERRGNTQQLDRHRVQRMVRFEFRTLKRSVFLHYCWNSDIIRCCFFKCVCIVCVCINFLSLLHFFNFDVYKEIDLNVNI